jgi:hypothetical protein
VNLNSGPCLGPALSYPAHLSGCLLQLLLQLLHSDLELFHTTQNLSPLLFQGQHLSLELGARDIFVLEKREVHQLEKPTAFQDQTTEARSPILQDT